MTQLKQSLASYLAKVKAGASLLITDRGLGVAVLSPVPWDLEDEAMRDLVLNGQVTLPLGELSEDFFHGPTVRDPDGSLRRFLAEERGER